MQEQISEKVLIRENLRFATYRGVIRGESVFIKTAKNESLVPAVAMEAAGLQAMRALDPDEHHYLVPSVLYVSDDTLVTTWVEGRLMAEDLHESTADYMFEKLSKLFVFLDSASKSTFGMTRFNRLGETNGIDKTMIRLSELDYSQHIDAGLVTATEAFARKTIGSIETRFTHGDLQPGNIMMGTDGKLWVIDCESCDNLWPRHYNIVNYVFNNGSRSAPWFPEKLRNLIDRYFETVELDPGLLVSQINFSAAMRCLQSIDEILGGHTEVGSAALMAAKRAYIEKTMQNITAGKLFYE